AEYLTVLGAEVTGIARSSGERGGHPVRTPAELPQLLPDTDVLVNILPATTATAGIVDERVLRALPPRAWVVNVGRGATVDEPALLHALESGMIAGAALDVFATEPLPADSPLWHAPNMIVTPHAAGGRPHNPEALIEQNLQLLLSDAPLVTEAGAGTARVRSRRRGLPAVTSPRHPRAQAGEHLLQAGTFLVHGRGQDRGPVQQTFTGLVGAFLPPLLAVVDGDGDLLAQRRRVHGGGAVGVGGQSDLLQVPVAQQPDLPHGAGNGDPFLVAVLVQPERFAQQPAVHAPAADTAVTRTHRRGHFVLQPVETVARLVLRRQRLLHPAG